MADIKQAALWTQLSHSVKRPPHLPSNGADLWPTEVKYIIPKKLSPCA